MVVAGAIGGAVYGLTSGGSSGGTGTGVAAQASANLGRAVAQLARLGFGGSDKLTNGGDESAKACTENSTGSVKQFLTRNPCREYSGTSINVHKKKITTAATVSWISMATSDLSVKYKKMADERRSALCYASGQSGDAVWVAQVKPTGRVAVDREILQAVAPAPLSAGYLAVNCTG